MKIELNFSLDGDAWMCYGPDFIDVQNSICAFAYSKQEAAREYIREYFIYNPE